MDKNTLCNEDVRVDHIPYLRSDLPIIDQGMPFCYIAGAEFFAEMKMPMSRIELSRMEGIIPPIETAMRSALKSDDIEKYDRDRDQSFRQRRQRSGYVY